MTGYGLSKKFVIQTIMMFCEQNNINCFCLRLFYLFVEKEASNSFIPILIDNKSIDSVPGEQRYVYMFVKDLVEKIYKTINSQIMSGIYNLTFNKSITLS